LGERAYDDDEVDTPTSAQLALALALVLVFRTIIKFVRARGFLPPLPLLPPFPPPLLRGRIPFPRLAPFAGVVGWGLITAAHVTK
jgi:hypothetical protein